MQRKALKVVTELHFRTVSCPGVHLWAKDDVYLSVCVMGQHRKSPCVPAVFPLLLQQKMTFEKIFQFAVDPGDIAVMMEYETVKIELVQLTPPVTGLPLLSDGDTLAWFEEDSRHFLFPEPKLLPSYSGVGREVLMTRAPHFPGIAPRLEFWTKTTICECSAVVKSNVYPNVSTVSLDLSELRNPGPTAPAYGLTRGLRISSRYLMAVRLPLASTWRTVRPPKEMPPHTMTDPPPNRSCWRMLQAAERSPRRLQTLSRLSHMVSSWPGAGGTSSPPLRRPAPLDRSPAPRKPSPTPLRSMSAGSIPSSSPESDAPIGQQHGASPSALWRSYRQQQSRWNGSEDSWEEVQERVRGLLTTPKAMRRLLYGSTVSEVEEVLTRRSISPGRP
ncbi:unnamed protein product [Lota lota]